MTQEEKLEEAKRLYQTANADQRYVLESLFPELAESEDERIRKSLIEHLQCDVDDMANSDCAFDFEAEIEELSKYIAWLEKQGQVKESDISQHENKTCEENDDSLTDDERIRKALIRFFQWFPYDRLNDENLKPKEAIAWLEKQGEKPKKVSIWKHWKDGIAGCAEGEQIFLIKIGNVYSISSCLGYECDYIELSELDKLMRDEKQGKSKWGDDDEQYLLVCKNALRKYQVSDKWDADIISKWLEDKLKQGEQKPKWTEEDDDMLESIICHLQDGRTRIEFQYEIDWIKSLKTKMEEQLCNRRK